ncbi:putative phage tail protein [Sporosarcina obsidiansis]|uniref:putative phage tail protein n=1 Tax=Sporosarcina obsidiansis TaxID=2660748 RepID=UPI00129AD293|nr:putative phage tail protein [Sporosarcina obsidiansis]
MNRLERMKSYLPEHFAESPEIIAILEDGDRRFEELNLAMDDVFNQFFVETATWGLDKWEYELEIFPSTTEFQERRNQILSKLINQTPTNYKALENEINRFLSSPTSKVRLIKGRYAMEITIPLGDIKEWLSAELTNTIEEMKPAHLAALFIGIVDGILGIITAKQYTFPVPYPTTGTFYTAPINGVASKATVEAESKSYNYQVPYPITGTFYCSEGGY